MKPFEYLHIILGNYLNFLNHLKFRNVLSLNRIYNKLMLKLHYFGCIYNRNRTIYTCLRLRYIIYKSRKFYLFNYLFNSYHKKQRNYIIIQWHI